MSTSSTHSLGELYWETEFDTDNRIIQATVSGKRTNETHNALISDLLKLSASHNAHLVLIDFSSAEIGMTIAEIFDRPKKARDLGVNHRYRVACVFNSRYEEISRFWETVSINQGLNYKVFSSKEQARDWLLGALPSTVS